MDMSRRQPRVISGPQTFENILAFLTNTKAVKEHLTQLKAATEENRKSAEEYRQAVAQVVEADKIVQAVTAAQADRGKASKELEEAHKTAADLKSESVAKAKQVMADAQREVLERKKALAQRDKELTTREQTVEETANAAAAMMAKAQGMQELATAMRDVNKAKAQRMAEAAQS